jgi:transcriptional regulator with XRE-family HTH domain/Zn-dependent peptidase ImmA (M78 family)
MGKHKTPAEREIALRVGARIRQLREIQHISQIRLATEIGIRAGPLGWIEKGKHLPSGRVLYRIAKQLNVRLDDLFQESDVWQGAPAASDLAPVVLPPLAAEGSAEAVKATHIVCQSIAEKLGAIEELCGALKTPAVALALPFSPTEQGAEHLAARVRQSLGIGDALISDYLEVLEGAGLRVVFLDMPDGCDAFGGYDRVNRNAILFGNSRLKKQPERQLERLIAELGRVLWHAAALAGLKAEELSEEPALDEAQFARRFADCFQMPATALRALAWQLGLGPKDWTLELLLRLKRRCGVSAQSFAVRLQGLGLSWSDKQKRSPRHYLFKEELDALCAEGGPAAEPGGSRAPLAMNGRLCDLLLCAEQKAQDQKALNAVKRVLRQSGVKLDA